MPGLDLARLDRGLHTGNLYRRLMAVIASFTRHEIAWWSVNEITKFFFIGAGLHETGVDIYRSFHFRKLVYGIDPVRACVIFQDIAMVMEQGIRACKAEADRQSHVVKLILHEKAAKHPRSVSSIYILFPGQGSVTRCRTLYPCIP